MDDPIKKHVTLKEVELVAPKKYRAAKQQVALTPKGMADKKSVDSLRSVGYDKVIGEPMKQKGYIDRYGNDQSDVIKKLLKQ